MSKLVGVGLMVVLVCAPAARARAQAVPAAEPPPPGVALPTPEGFRLTEPMSARMLFFRVESGGWKVNRGGAVVMDSPLAAGLDRIVSPSPRALQLALNAHRELVTGAALTWTGVGLSLASAIVGLVLVGENPVPQNGSAPTWAVVGISICLGTLVAGIVLELVGIFRSGAGLHDEIDAVNAYNADLVDGRLLPTG